MSLQDVLAYEARRAAKKAVPSGEGVEDESELHQAISRECKARGWIAFHGSMAHKAMRTLGECDFTILADRSRVFFIEAKTRTGKLSSEQLGKIAWADKLGHKIHVVRNLEQFLSLL